MIVQCCICRVIEGVKCPKCGTLLAEEGKQAPLETYLNNRYLCPNVDCTVIDFHGGDGPNGATNVYSHGYCRPCLNGIMAKIPKKQPAFAFYLQ